MTFQHRTRGGLAAALAVASLAVAASPAGADPNPAQRVQSSHRGAAMAQEQYYTSHKPAIPATGHDFRTIDASDSARETEAALAQEQYYASYPSTTSTPRHAARTIDESPSANGFEWGDAAIGAGSALGLVLAFAGAAAAITRRHRPATS
jgi:hypothetical protein